MALEISKAGLTTQQAAFVASYLENPSARAAATAAGYKFPENGYQALRSPAVQKAIEDARARMIATEGATLAYQTLVDCMKPGNPGAVRVAAAKTVWQAAGMMEKGAIGAEKSLQDMSADELMATIAKLDLAMSDRADGAKPIKPSVIEG